MVTNLVGKKTLIIVFYFYFPIGVRFGQDLALAYDVTPVTPAAQGIHGRLSV